ncbi:MAG: FeoA family protein [Firmicutes bacterium]|uniref:Ferrous iron transport protein A n=1 Tax=Melghirimyces thermohalophilus TaxID=1236220 RepID=A0A1G6JJX2_9BACL|nr:FeoA family protein [Melghirimyces thermohalophilus]MDA8352256.1 FeoA family protein [Bacillota bacterium]SDC18967.1 ferrous iron transport protein A [Melghirimyces thermohalophilus]
MSAEISLSRAQPGQTLRIRRMSLTGNARYRLLDLGFVPGATVDVLQKSPLGDPIAFRVRHTTIALRREEYGHIFGEIIRRG